MSEKVLKAGEVCEKCGKTIHLSSYLGYSCGCGEKQQTAKTDDVAVAKVGYVPVAISKETIMDLVKYKQMVLTRRKDFMAEDGDLPDIHVKFDRSERFEGVVAELKMNIEDDGETAIVRAITLELRDGAK